jgi:hypothetical protein
MAIKGFITLIGVCMSKNNGKLRAVPENIRLVRKLMGVANALAYYDTAIIMAIKSYIVFNHSLDV